MTNLSASTLAGRHVRQARERRGWTAAELAGRCAKAGAPQITSTVVTNLETRRRESRQVSVDELLVLAHVLEVPPLQLITPLDAGETLEVLPGTEMGPLEAPAWIAGDPPGELLRLTSVPVPGYTGEMLRRGDPGSALTIVRQLRIVTRRIAEEDGTLADTAFLAKHPEAASAYEAAMRVMADRLWHLAARMDALGYDPPGLDAAREILKRHGLPAALREWREQAAGGDETARDEEGNADGPGTRPLA